MSALGGFIVWPGLAALAASLLVTALMMRAGVMDEPGARSSHDAPTPRGGGLGVAAGLAAGALVALIVPLAPAQVPALLAFTIAMSALGLADDLVTPGPRLKFAAMALACLAASFSIGPVTRLALEPGGAGLALGLLAGLAGSALFLFVTLNAVNFLDGSDGMLAAILIPAGAGLSVAGLSLGVLSATLAGVCLAGALAGFLVLNRPKASVFAGDAGSLGAAGAYGAGALALASHGGAPGVWLAVLFIAPVLTDVLLTLLKRALGGRFSLQAHREHAYQRLIARGWSHGAVALCYVALSAGCVLTGLVAVQMGGAAAPLAFTGWIAVLSAGYLAVAR